MDDIQHWGWRHSHSPPQHQADLKKKSFVVKPISILLRFEVELRLGVEMFATPIFGCHPYWRARLLMPTGNVFDLNLY